ncbi:hypothetical protein DVH24_013142 [Malus domestica]|uniref:Uncharacterized protein n=1 Tax=Malus domestica TaxID=3750 RepID=A0A498IPC4_MALDO|nr:hypothetical protein DVH24_013142 [Malus domestica]
MILGKPRIKNPFIRAKIIYPPSLALSSSSYKSQTPGSVSTIQTLNGTPLITLGTVRLMVQMKPFKHLMTFNVMDNPSPYKAIFGRE